MKYARSTKAVNNYLSITIRTCLVVLTFVGLVFFGHRALALEPVPCSNGAHAEKSEATTYCIQYLINVLTGGTTPTSAPIGKVQAELTSVMTSGSSVPSGSAIAVSLRNVGDLASYIKDMSLMTFVTDIVLIFGVGYLLAHSIYKR
jgi:hypothetical protein